MKLHKSIILYFLIFTSTTIASIVQAHSEVNDTVDELVLRGSILVGDIYWGYSTENYPDGPGSVFSFSALYSYNIFGCELNISYADFNELQWSEEDFLEKKHEYKTTGSGRFAIIDLKLGTKLFASKGDIGYILLYLGSRYWKGKWSEESREIDGVTNSIILDSESYGRNWIIGFRDFSSLGDESGLSFVLQTGFYLAIPIKMLETNYYESNGSRIKNSSITGTFGGEFGIGLALQEYGCAITIGFRGERITINPFRNFDNPFPSFILGYAGLFIEASYQF